MARPLRIELSGGIYHVTSRGDGREDIFLADAGREQWLEVLGQVCERFNWVCHAWCQMTNHYHLLIETPEANLAQGMRQLNGVYTQRFNRDHQRVGHVFHENWGLALTHPSAKASKEQGQSCINTSLCKQDQCRSVSIDSPHQSAP